jgi:hypothetical protein
VFEEESGGGALLIVANIFENNGIISCNGGNAELCSSGGGGSGGSIKMKIFQLIKIGNVKAIGGEGGTCSSTNVHPTLKKNLNPIINRGGNGGVGRVRIECFKNNNFLNDNKGRIVSRFFFTKDIYNLQNPLQNPYNFYNLQNKTLFVIVKTK